MMKENYREEAETHHAESIYVWMEIMPVFLFLFSRLSKAYFVQSNEMEKANIVTHSIRICVDGGTLD